MRLIYSQLIVVFLTGCYGINSQTSQIGDLSTKCLKDSVWTNLMEKFSTKRITDSSLIIGVDMVKNHFINPKYILYFDEEPREIVGCDYYSVRAVYNPEIDNQVLDGLSPQLSDMEQIRIRNRVQKVLMEFQCIDGRNESLERMKEPAPFSKEYYEQNK